MARARLKKEIWLQRVKNSAAVILATGAYVGYIPYASGTMGSILGVGIVWMLRSVPLTLYVILSLVLGAGGVWASKVASQHFKRMDASQIVIDEIVGFMITMLAIPRTGYWLVLAFIVFRFFDIVKPFPINLLNRIHSGWGIMLDDVLAGVFGNIVLHLAMRARL